MVAFETGWDSFEKKFWFSWDVWDKWDKNGKFLFNLTKLHLSVSQSLLAQELLLFMVIDIIKVRVRAQR
jgi:hypothetical protein